MHRLGRQSHIGAVVARELAGGQNLRHNDIYVHQWTARRTNARLHGADRDHCTGR